MSTTKPDTDTGWTTEFAALGDGWYWSRKTSLPRPRKDVLHVVRSQVAFGSMWLNPVADPTFFENREWLGPISPSDFEQLTQLRKIAAQFVTAYEGKEHQLGNGQALRSFLQLREALAHKGDQS